MNWLQLPLSILFMCNTVLSLTCLTDVEWLKANGQGVKVEKENAYIEENIDGAVLIIEYHDSCNVTEFKISSDNFKQDGEEVILIKAVDYENLQENNMLITAIDQDGGKFYGNIIYTGVNDNPLYFSSGQQSITQIEGKKNDALIEVEPEDYDKDEDMNGITYSLEFDDTSSSSKFHITSKGPKASMSCEELDYEEIRLYYVTIVATDSEGKYKAKTTVIVEVTDSPDQPPMWTKVPSTVDLSEDSKVGDTIFEAVAKDGDAGVNADIEYSIVSAKGTSTSGSEEIDMKEYIDIKKEDKSAIVIVKKEMDRESENVASMFEVVVKAKEKNEDTDDNTEVEATVTVKIKDVNDNVPSFSETLYTATVKEDALGNIKPDDDSLQVTDMDELNAGSFTVSIVEDQYQACFTVVTESGEEYGMNEANFVLKIQDSQCLDYETEDQEFNVTLVATEKEDPNNQGSATLTILLVDVNDEVPVFQEPLYTATIKENQKQDDKLITVKATDDDLSQEYGNSSIIYEISSQSDNMFKINPKTGEISLAKDCPLDYDEGQITTNVTVQAYDNNKKTPFQSGSCTVMVDIEDVNDETPAFGEFSKNLDLNETSENIALDISITAEDRDMDAELEFSIDWDGSSAMKRGAIVNKEDYDYTQCFTLNSASDANDEAVLNVISAVDYERIDSVQLEITVTDKNTQANQDSTSTSINIQILNEIDESPYFINYEDSSYSITEETDRGDMYVGIVEIDDPDDGDEFEFEITCPEELDDLLKIETDYKRGTIKTNKGTVDREAGYPVIYVNVTVTDKAGNSDTTQITVEVEDKNDHDPVFVDSTGIINLPEIEIRENIHVTNVATYKAKDDIDSDLFATMEYTLDKDSSTEGALAKFQVDSFDGSLSLKDEATLDREGLPEYTIRVVATDDNGNGRSKYMDVKVKVSDENDEEPQLMETNKECWKISEDAKVEDVIPEAIITATDDDKPQTNNSLVDFELLRIFDDTRQEVQDPLFTEENSEENYCNIIVNEQLRDRTGMYWIEIQAMDRGEDAVPVVKNYSICITDYNYYDPQLTFDSNPIVLLETSSVGQKLQDSSGDPFTVETTDKDGDQYTAFTFTIEKISKNRTEDDGVEEEDPPVTFELDPEESSTTILLKKTLDREQYYSYQITIKVCDGGENPRERCSRATIYVIIDDVNDNDPVFEQNQDSAQFLEETMDQDDYTFKGANDPDYGDTVYYYIVGLDYASEYFEIPDHKVNKIRLIKELDRESNETNGVVEVVIQTTDTLQEPPPVSHFDPKNQQTMLLTVIIDDVIDQVPKLEDDLNGEVTQEDAIGDTVMVLKAVDLDVNDNLTYCITDDKIEASDESLQQVAKANPFHMNNETGEIIQNFKVQPDMTGFFSFQVTVVDTANLRSTELVKIYVVASEDRVEFIFLNTVSEVEAKRKQVEEIFTEELGYACSVDDIVKTTTDEGDVVDGQTSIITHFVDSQILEVVAKATIETEASDLRTMERLSSRFGSIELVFHDINVEQTEGDDNTKKALKIVVIVLACVIALLLIILLVVHILRVRSLKRQIRALSIPAADEKDPTAGDIMATAVPNTNAHAAVGSNPIWNLDQEALQNDNISESSGDSILIGVEDNPEFRQYQPQPPPRRNVNVQKFNNPLLNGKLQLEDEKQKDSRDYDSESVSSEDSDYRNFTRHIQDKLDSNFTFGNPNANKTNEERPQLNNSADLY